ncbi:MAG: hypothetical protein ACK512_04125, partial [Cyanobium sp.]
MAFYTPDPAMGETLAHLVNQLASQGRPGLADEISITWLRYSQSLLDRAASLSGAAFEALPVAGAGWGGERQRYPASVVKLVYLVAAEAWLKRQWLGSTDELQRALADMVRESSNDATGYVMDLLSGTTSGVELPAEAFAEWSHQRQGVNRWLMALGWPELEGSNASQKTWGDGPYGRERQSYG